MQPALQRLRAEADAALEIKPMSVMDKSRTPPSGDKHDYLSQAPYFWPNPSQPNGLPYIRKDGARNPEVDQGTDRPAIGRMMVAVGELSAGYYFTGNQAYAQHAAKLVRTWFIDPATRMNPHLEYAQGIPGINTGRGIGLIEVARLGHLCDSLTLIEPSGAWTKADAEGFRAWLAKYFEWLTTSENGRDEADEKNNHGSWYDVQASSLALFLGRREVAQKLLSDGLATRIEFQIQPDGSQPLELARTKSLNYSTMNLEALFTCARIAQKVGVDWWNHQGKEGQSLLRALRYIAPYADPSKPWPKKDLIDGDRGSILALVAEGTLHWDDPELKRLLDQLGERQETRSARWHLLLNLPE